MSFILRHGDADLLALHEASVPPPDLQKVSIFSSHVAKYQQKATDEVCYRFRE